VLPGLGKLTGMGDDGVADREWSAKRVIGTLRMMRNPEFVKWRWNLHVVKPRYGIETVRDRVLDARYGGNCGGTYSSRWDHMGYRGTSSAHYYYLGKVFAEHNVPIGPDDVLVDVGCGKGRVLNFWLHRGLRNRMVGIEIDERWAEFAERRLSSYDNVEVLCGDAFELLPPESSVVFIFNPFTRETTQRFKEHLEHLRPPGADLTLVYYMANYADLFAEDPSWEVTTVTDNTYHPTIIARLVGSRPVGGSDD